MADRMLGRSLYTAMIVREDGDPEGSLLEVRRRTLEEYAVKYYANVSSKAFEYSRIQEDLPAGPMQSLYGKTYTRRIFVGGWRKVVVRKVNTSTFEVINKETNEPRKYENNFIWYALPGKNPSSVESPQTITKPEEQPSQNPISCYTKGTSINNRYKVITRIGYGSFATAFKVQDSHDNDKVLVAKVARKSDDVSGKYNMEVAALTKLVGIKHWPQMSHHFETASYRVIIMSEEGESLGNVLSRNNNGVFSNGNSLRVSYCLTKALDSLHHVGYVHRDINRDNITMKQQGKEIVITVIDLGNGSKSFPRQKCRFNSYPTSWHVMLGKEYCERDDFVSGLYLIAECLGAPIFNTKNKSLIDAKREFHNNPSSFFPLEQRWMAKLITIFDSMVFDKKTDLSPIWNSYATAIPRVSPLSPIEYEKINDVVVVQ
ncbi:unnamed protein product [Caenorhabditis nigoni]